MDKTIVIPLSKILGGRDSNSRDVTVPIYVAVVGSVTGAILGVQLFTSANPIGRCYVFWKQLRGQEKEISSASSVKKSVDDYSDMHRKSDEKTRNTLYKELVNSYYDLATLFYEWGWGQSFHFSFQYPDETFLESIRRHEYYLASKLGLPRYPKSIKDAHEYKILDVGCGIGGPMRNIARFTGCNITGVTLNPYQVSRGNELTAADPYAKSKCKSVQGDFMDLSQFDQNSFDAAYAIEATCHAPDRVKCYFEVLQTLKPGAIFAVYEWCTTDKYDPDNKDHQRMKKDIEEGNGLPGILRTDECLSAMRRAGFEILQEYDLAEKKGVTPWYEPLMPSWNPLSQRFQFNPLGGVLTNISVNMLELVGIAPKGTGKTQKILQAGGFALRDAGKEGIFTAMYLIVGRKPYN